MAEQNAQPGGWVAQVGAVRLRSAGAAARNAYAAMAKTLMEQGLSADEAFDFLSEQLNAVRLFMGGREDERG